MTADAAKTKNRPTFHNSSSLGVTTSTDKKSIETSIESAVSGLQYIEEKFGKFAISPEKFNKSHVSGLNTINPVSTTQDLSHGAKNNDKINGHLPSISHTNDLDHEATLSPLKSDGTASMILQDDGSLESKIRLIVKQEVEKSEKRVLKQVGQMISQLHSELIDQFVTNEVEFNLILDYGCGEGGYICLNFTM